MTETLKGLISRMSEGDVIEGLGNGEVVIKRAKGMTACNYGAEVARPSLGDDGRHIRPKAIARIMTGQRSERKRLP